MCVNISTAIERTNLFSVRGNKHHYFFFFYFHIFSFPFFSLFCLFPFLSHFRNFRESFCSFFVRVCSCSNLFTLISHKIICREPSKHFLFLRLRKCSSFPIAPHMAPRLARANVVRTAPAVVCSQATHHIRRSLSRHITRPTFVSHPLVFVRFFLFCSLARSRNCHHTHTSHSICNQQNLQEPKRCLALAAHMAFFASPPSRARRLTNGVASWA